VDIGARFLQKDGETCLFSFREMDDCPGQMNCDLAGETVADEELLG
jgi:hypothetical protein